MPDIAFASDASHVAELEQLMADQGLTTGHAAAQGTAEARLDGTSQLRCHTLVVGAVRGPQAALLATAKRHGAKRIVAVTPDAAAWQVREELGGRLIHVSVPQEADEVGAVSPAILLAQIVAAPFGSFLAADLASKSLLRLARRVAGHDVSIFISGPTGSGKEVLSRFIHDASPRACGPFIALNCAAIPENMLEAMLFGHEKGAFTGATGTSKGHVRAADGGTLLLDEISEMPLALQAKLLRVIQEKTVTPIGAQAEIGVDVRFIATSNRDMLEEVRHGRFREDLYYRLTVFPLATLPLAERAGDIPLLAHALLQRHARQKTPTLSEGALALLREHDWPGNVRELENVVQRALVLCDGAVIEAEDIVYAPYGLDIPGTPDAQRATNEGGTSGTCKRPVGQAAPQNQAAAPDPGDRRTSEMRAQTPADRQLATADRAAA